MKKLFVIRKYIMANSARQAIRIEKEHDVDDVWIDDKWKEENMQKGDIGFKKV